MVVLHLPAPRTPVTLPIPIPNTRSIEFGYIGNTEARRTAQHKIAPNEGCVKAMGGEAIQ